MNHHQPHNLQIVGLQKKGKMVMKNVWDLCKVLENPHRMTLLSEIYKSREGGGNVGWLVECMNGKLEAPAVTQYLKQIECIGLLRRERCGRYVNYYDDMREAAANVRDVAALIRSEIMASGSYDDRGMFRALMNAFRARVCHYLLNGGNADKRDICHRFRHLGKYLARDLQPAVESGLLTEYVGSYELRIPTDPVIRRVIELAA